MRSRKIIIICLMLILSALGVFLGVGYAAYNFLNNPSGDSNKSSVCAANSDHHLIIIQGDVAQPTESIARLCDRLTIRNLDDKEREIGFGEHNYHQAYDGVSEIILTKGQEFTITLVKTGSFRFHDHFQDEVNGSFTVR